MKFTRWRRPRSGWAGVAAFLVVCWIFTTASPASEPQLVSNDVCLQCHDELGESFHKTAHGIYLSGEAMPSSGSCQACHGPGSVHAESGEPGDILNPAKTDLIAGETTCLSCHTGHDFDGWDASYHRSASVKCADCHQVHVASGEKPVMRMSDRCLDCHSTVRAAGFMPSHHPVAEGKMECDDCHNVHGGAETFAMEESVREKCFKCHAGMEGPFVFEHVPVAEDCMICHTPHGSVADNLLKQGEPALCLNCHSMHFHAGVVSVDGEFDNPQAPERAGFSTPDGWKKAMLTKCTQCHSEIHGTDLPSQSISGGGAALTR